MPLQKNGGAENTDQEQQQEPRIIDVRIDDESNPAAEGQSPNGEARLQGEYSFDRAIGCIEDIIIEESFQELQVRRAKQQKKKLLILSFLVDVSVLFPHRPLCPF